MAKPDPELTAHKSWLGLLQPVGLVVSPPALVKAQAVPSENVAELQRTFVEVTAPGPPAAGAAAADNDEPHIADFEAFAREVLGWDPADLAGVAGGPDMPEALRSVLPDYGETLAPTYVLVDGMGVSSPSSRTGDPSDTLSPDPLLLVQVVARGTDLDAAAAREDAAAGWTASPQARLERLLREVKVPAGLLCNGDALRFVYAPSGESSGHLTFPVAGMREVAGRPILSALHMLLSSHRVIEARDGARLRDILADSRKYQADVSNALSEQVLGALWELLRGFQAASERSGATHESNTALRSDFDHVASEEPAHVYGGLLTLLMRMIFVLYAEDQGLMPAGELFASNYSVGGLFDRLRADAGRYPDTMDERYGAYAWLLSLFRLLFDGGGHGALRLPTRHGQLFNPDEYPFLEGRPRGVRRVKDEPLDAPRVSDGCIYRVLDALLMLDVDGDGVADRLSYRALDVEQIGSVYEAMMGYDVERAAGPSIAVGSKHVVVDLDSLLAMHGSKRNAWLKEHAATELSGKSATALKSAASHDDVVAALGRRVSSRSLDASGNPRLMRAGALYLQPGEERRRTGSHYTPRELTEPIVRTTLRPVIEALGERPTPEQILDLKVCDPAMGSGAFLVEATRQLAEQLLRAWELHDAMPPIPLDEEPLLHARRLVAQRCIYGVDKNPFAVNLAKLSIWLITLARDHAFTFVDHALKHGDSLVGLTKAQIAAFHWKSGVGEVLDLFDEKLKVDIARALGWRSQLHGSDEGAYDDKRAAWWQAEDAIADARLIGDLAIAAFFGADKEKSRELLRDQYRDKIEVWRSDPDRRAELLAIAAELREGDKPVPPLHWEIEFPEVFERENPGFDAMVGNPPFLGGTMISTANGSAYLDWITSSFEFSGGRMDLVAYFFRNAFALQRSSGTFGLVATNTVGQGDTRVGGLAAICGMGGFIYAATRRRRWPGAAAVVVSVVHIRKEVGVHPCILDGAPRATITAFLAHGGGNKSPARLSANFSLSYSGVKQYGDGFLFEDGKDKATPLARLREIVDAEPGSVDVVFPFIGGAEVNSHAAHQYRRWIINFGMRDEATVRRNWPLLMDIVERKVKPERRRKAASVAAHPWWQFWRPRNDLYSAICGRSRVLVCSQVSAHHAFAFVPASWVFSHALNIFAVESDSAFCLLQSQPHEVWARFFGSSMKDDLRYTPSDCFETFPFPRGWTADSVLDSAGRAYYEFRADLMLRNNEGLTATYNRFHDPNNHEPDIVRLRELHAEMDRAVLDAYGWHDIPTDCEFLLDYEIDDESWGNKKKPYRYRWPDDVHDEVLARLLDLNQKRYQDEVAAGLHDKANKGGKKKRAATGDMAGLPLFAGMEGGDDDEGDEGCEDGYEDDEGYEDDGDE